MHTWHRSRRRRMSSHLQLLIAAFVLAATPTVASTHLLPVHRDDASAASNSCKQPAVAWMSPPLPVNTCPPAVLQLSNTIYLLYDVNLAEGFNLRRDVYVRLAVFARELQQRGGLFAKLRLVLPTWPRLYHWHSHGLRQSSQPWRNFFDMESMRRYAPVIDFDEFQTEFGYSGQPEWPYINIDQIYRLEHFDIMLEQGVFRDKFEIKQRHCSEGTNVGGQLLRQPFLQYSRYNCMRFQGSASLLERVLRQALREYNNDEHFPKPYVIAILSAEVVLHDHWGDANFWQARRSMRFSSKLTAIANDFRRQFLKSNDTTDAVQRPHLWELERPYRSAIGGNYVCAHLRRGDFLQGRQSTMPTLRSAATQIKQRMRAFNVTTIFVATDATPYELMELKEEFYRFRFIYFNPESQTQRQDIKDGGIAIVDQLICAHARYFIGTYESTFTYRIYEEREILGFAKQMTFNTFCKQPDQSDCPRNSVWPIAYAEVPPGANYAKQ